MLLQMDYIVLSLSHIPENIALLKDYLWRLAAFCGLEHCNQLGMKSRTDVIFSAFWSSVSFTQNLGQAF